MLWLQIRSPGKSSVSLRVAFENVCTHLKFSHNTKGVFFWYIFLPFLFFADFGDIENLFFWESIGKTADFEGFKTFCL